MSKREKKGWGGFEAKGKGRLTCSNYWEGNGGGGAEKSSTWEENGYGGSRSRKNTVPRLTKKRERSPLK